MTRRSDRDSDTPPYGFSDRMKRSLLAEIEKGQQLAGHFPDADALDRAARILEGDLSAADAWAEFDAKYAGQRP